MTDEQIIKALDGCVSSNCTKCPHNTEDGCTDALMQDAIDLIDGQRLEIDRLTDTLNATIAGQETLQRYIATAKAEAIKEFAERFKGIAGIYQKDTYVIGTDEFDNLVKEMVGDEDG